MSKAHLIGYVTLAFAVHLIQSISASNKGCLTKMHYVALNTIRPEYDMDAMWETQCRSWKPKNNKQRNHSCIFKWSHCPSDEKYVMEQLREIQCRLAFSAKVVHTYTCHGAELHLLLPFGDHIISVDRDNMVIVWDVESEVDITSCGNFVVVGLSSGHIDVYNKQSGMHRGHYGEDKAHKGPVRGVSVDGLNQLIISGGADKLIKIWKFKSRKLVHFIDLGTLPVTTHLHQDSGMLAIALDDFTLNVLDMETKRIVRKFPGHRGQVNDMPSWLITAAMDCTIRTWDLSSGCLVDCFLVDTAAVSLTMSPTGDFLASSHVDSLVQQHFVQYGVTAPPAFRLRACCQEPVPTKKCNKPKEPPKVPKAAPFFMHTIPGLIPQFAPSEGSNQEEQLKIVNFGVLAQKSHFYQQLESATLCNKYDGPVGMLKEMGPSGIDAELRGLAPDMGGDVSVLQGFLKMVASMLNSKRDFDLAQAYLALFLKLHLRLITQEPELMEEASRVSEKLEETWTSMQTLINQSLCLLSYTKSALL